MHKHHKAKLERNLKHKRWWSLMKQFINLLHNGFFLPCINTLQEGFNWNACFTFRWHQMKETNWENQVVSQFWSLSSNFYQRKILLAELLASTQEKWHWKKLQYWFQASTWVGREVLSHNQWGANQVWGVFASNCTKQLLLLHQ